MADPFLDELNTTTLKEIFPRKVADNYFLDTPFQAYLRDHAFEPFGGGAFMQSVFLYAPMIGGSYAKGANFNITKRQTLAPTLFDPKYYEVAVPEYKEDIQVTNKGPLAVFKLIDIDMKNAVMTLSAIVGLALNNHGQAAGVGIIGSRPNDVNGWIEALNDGVTYAWDGSTFTSYGMATRNGVVGSALNSVVQWGGTATGGGAPITYQWMEESYQTASIGRREPNLGVCNKALYAYIKERIQPQQRFAQERDPFFGVSGMRMNSAMILKDDYFPSLKYGVNNADLGNYLTGTITNSLVAPTPGGFPTAIAAPTLTVGEVFAWFNTSTFALRISDDEEYGGGFSGFVPAQDNTRVVGTVKMACNLECFEPRLNAVGYGFTG